MELAMIAKTYFLAKTLVPYKLRILREAKSLRDHVRALSGISPDRGYVGRDVVWLGWLGWLGRNVGWLGRAVGWLGRAVGYSGGWMGAWAGSPGDPMGRG
jgi:hypothetical protein